MKSWIIQTLENKHTSFSGLIVMCLQIAAVIWPQYSTKFAEISGIVTAYALFQAGDAKTQGAKIDQLKQDTATLTKDQVKP